MSYVLYGRPRWGSAIVEAQLAWYGLPFKLEFVGDLLREPESRAKLEKVNPLAQIPTLVMPDGTARARIRAPDGEFLMTSKQLRIGVAGAGHFGRYHALKAAASARAELVGVYDPDMERAKTVGWEAGAPALPLDQLLASYQRGAELLKFCRSRLQVVEQQVQALEGGEMRPWGEA